MYEAYSDYESMMNMAEEIVTRCAMATHGKLKVDYEVIMVFILILVWAYIARSSV
jgi:lysyl-tRNA synthetase class II